jgi:predicted Rossmann fold nucleotide-binding protein DprA/Smf involved in DNA uptake
VNKYQSLGDRSLLTLSSTAFLCSRKVSAASVLKSYDWALEQVKSGTCVIGGFHSKLERDVLHFLLKGNQPLIIVLARGFYKRWTPEIRARLDKGNLLVISPFDEGVTKVDRFTSMVRNKLIIELADKIVVGYASPDGVISRLLKDLNKPLEFLDR